jgi:hypothetical protein
MLVDKLTLVGKLKRLLILNYLFKVKMINKKQLYYLEKESMLSISAL